MKTIILHQVNCKGVMGAGFALVIRRKFPDCYSGYRKYCRENNNLLGKVYIYENDDYIILNMFSQDDYGINKIQTDYNAMEIALKYIRELYPYEIITAPYKIGCGLAGGDWDIVSKLLEKYNISISTHIKF